jgi:hypothetical protein
MLGLTKNDEVEQTDSLKLSELNTSHAPYHLLNATLNLSTTAEAYLKARKGDFFVFSKRYIGSKTTGYCRTEDMEANNHQMNLATAMAISGGAAAPNAGKTTVKALVFILAMLNIRYDYWILNPKRLKKSSFKKMLTQVTDRPGPIYFLRELIGNLSAKSNYVNLSDGGHLENLGIYELIRRECRLIISGDSEADATLTFSGLADVIRMVQIDFGVKIVMQGLDEIRAGKQNHAIGTIFYKNGKVGKLLYLKSSLLGDQSLIATLSAQAYSSSKERNDNLLFDANPYIAHYKQEEPSFPHQSSSNQFYTETQFESYRALGQQLTLNTLKNTPKKTAQSKSQA